MGVSASNVSSDLADKAKLHAAARESMIESEAKHYAERTGMDLDQATRVVRDTVDGARRRMKLAGGEQTPNFVDHGIAAPVTINGEVFGTYGVEYHKGGDRTMEVSRPIGAGRFETKRIRLCVDGGERTRVVAEAR